MVFTGIKKDHFTLLSLVILNLAVLTSIHPVGRALAVEPSGFSMWLTDLKKEALSKGISKSTLDKALKDLKPIPLIIKLDRTQPEIELSLEEYLNRVVTDSVIAKGRKKFEENRELLMNISRHYHIQPQFLVALWGIETRFGEREGRFPVVGAVATLAHDGRRSALFRRELFYALQILDEGHISLDEMRGSWAGAMGQVQFMPSSFYKFAVDYEGDGRIDLWNSLGDIFASAANYLALSGWRGNEIWGREVTLPKDFDPALVGLGSQKRLSEWQILGVRLRGDSDLGEKPDLPSSVVQPDGPDGRAFLVYQNYRALLKWNRSHLFAIAAGILADEIVGH
jgi:membrane-bound lytic murein transglycosylase B